MSIIDDLGFPWKQIRDSIDYRIGRFALRAGKHPCDNITVFLFIHFQIKVTFTGRTAEDFYDCFSHDGTPYLIVP